MTLSRTEKYNIAKDLGFSSKEAQMIRDYGQKRFERVLESTKYYDNTSKMIQVSNPRQVDEREYKQKINRRKTYLSNRDRYLKQYAIAIGSGFSIDEAKAIQQKPSAKFKEIVQEGRYKLKNRDMPKVRNIQWGKWSKVQKEENKAFGKGMPEWIVEKARQVNRELNAELQKDKPVGEKQDDLIGENERLGFAVVHLWYTEGIPIEEAKNMLGFDAFVPEIYSFKNDPKSLVG